MRRRRYGCSESRGSKVMITSQSGGFPRASAYPFQCMVVFLGVPNRGVRRLGCPRIVGSIRLAVPEPARARPAHLGETSRPGAARTDAVLSGEMPAVAVEGGQFRTVPAGPAGAFPLSHGLGASRRSREPALGQAQLPRQQSTGSTMARSVTSARRRRPHRQRHLDGCILQMLRGDAVTPADGPGNLDVMNRGLHFYRPASVDVLLGALRARRISQSGILSGFLRRRRSQ